jgi:hypothetical protein
MSQPPYPGQPHPEQPNQGEPYYGQSYSSQPYPGQPSSGQPSSGQPSSGQPSSGQPAFGQSSFGQSSFGQASYGQASYGQPDPVSPWSGQPNPDTPSSVPPQPGFPPPGYGQQPSYGQAPPYGQPSYGDQPTVFGQPTAYGEPTAYGQPTAYGEQPGFPPPQPPKKSKAVPIVLVSLAVLLVLCVGGGTAIFMAGRNKAKEIVDTAKDAANSPPSPAGTPTGKQPQKPQSKITVTEPKTLGGRPKLTDAQFSTLADELQKGLASVPNATATVGALYGTPAKQDIVIIASAAAPIANPKRELDSTFLGAGIGGLKVTGIKTINAGPLGGVAKCGKADAGGIDLAMCSWADDGSVGWIMSFFKSVNSAKTEFPKLRGQIEKKSS